MTPTPPAAAAIDAFLRGCERRAGVFLRWYVEDPALADPIWQQARAGFATAAAGQPMPEWPRLFWASLLASPLLLQTEPAQGVPIPGLGRLGRGPRAVLLLHLAAGLDDAEAARVLGIGEDTFRLALQRSKPRLHDGRDDSESWRLLHQRIQQQLRGEAAVTPRRPASAQPLPADAPPAWQAFDSRDGADASEPAPARWRNPAMAAVALLTVAALALTFGDPQALLDDAPATPDGALAEPTIRTEALADASTAANVALDADTRLLLDPDYEFLAAVADWDTLDTLAFDAWHAAQLAQQRAEEAARLAELQQSAEPDDAEAAPADDSDWMDDDAPN